MVRFVLLSLIMSPYLLAQSTRDSFVIDKSKAFAYLAFDHIGPRTPAGQGESTEGLWLRVVNNCNIPIVLRSHAIDGNSGLILDDEVVPETPMLQIVGSPEQVKAAEQEEQDRRDALKHKPEGYESEVSGALRVQPGTEALFSVPRDHVGRFWFLRIRFALDASRSSIAGGPFTDLDFHEYELPKEKR